MRWSGTAAILGLALALASPASAQSTSSSSEPPDVVASSGELGPPPARVGYGAMPGGLHVATAEVLPPGTFEIAGISGELHADPPAGARTVGRPAPDGGDRAGALLQGAHPHHG